MRIVEIGDCSMVIMKDSEDPPWVSVGDVYRKAHKRHGHIYVNQITPPYDQMMASEFIYTAGRLVLFFQDAIRPNFCLHDRIQLDII